MPKSYFVVVERALRSYIFDCETLLNRAKTEVFRSLCEIRLKCAKEALQATLKELKNG